MSLVTQNGKTAEVFAGFAGTQMLSEVPPFRRQLVLARSHTESLVAVQVAGTRSLSALYDAFEQEREPTDLDVAQCLTESLDRLCLVFDSFDTACSFHAA